MCSGFWGPASCWVIFMPAYLILTQPCEGGLLLKKLRTKRLRLERIGVCGQSQSNPSLPLLSNTQLPKDNYDEIQLIQKCDLICGESAITSQHGHQTVIMDKSHLLCVVHGSVRRESIHRHLWAVTRCWHIGITLAELGGIFANKCV